MKPAIDTVLVLNEVGQQIPVKLLQPLHSVDQLREAQVKVLREAAENVTVWLDAHQRDRYVVRESLRRMVDELEQGAIRGLA